MITNRMKFLDRLATYGLGDPECWPWPGNRRLGYGRAMVGGKIVSVHRAAYEHFVGPIPKGMKLDHLCRNPSCFNPEHMEIVTQAENIRRGNGVAAIHARKMRCSRGHEFTPENTLLYTRPNGNEWRRCRQCTREHSREKYRRDHGQAPLL